VKWARFSAGARIPVPKEGLMRPSWVTAVAVESEMDWINFDLMFTSFCLDLLRLELDVFIMVKDGVQRGMGKPEK